MKTGTATRAYDFSHVLACGCRAWRAGLASGIDYCALHDAAADLLTALDGTLNWLTSYQGRGADVAYDVARAAIRKAKGE